VIARARSKTAWRLKKVKNENKVSFRSFSNSQRTDMKREREEEEREEGGEAPD
jgi:hypothetical protein